jgi:uncharacterized protein (UPF0303 family)
MMRHTVVEGSFCGQENYQGRKINVVLLLAKRTCKMALHLIRF